MFKWRLRWRAATRQVAGRYAAEELEWEPFHKTFLFPPGCKLAVLDARTLELQGTIA